MSSADSERQHRASRSGRCAAAAALVATMATLTALALASAVSAGLVLILDLALGITAAALLHSVVVQLRRQSARGRAIVAARAAEEARKRGSEHIAFATALGNQLRAARIEADQWGARARQLEVQLGEVQVELAAARDTLWISEAAEKRARAALVIAEQTQEPGRHLRPA
ncbi:MAG TPA: hypothetical protein VM093_01655 [Aeromicrobium sp.]|nr:hypothetical protein [Aeromicrobium sp.]